MSKGDCNQGDKGKVKFRVIEFELEGSDSTLQESLRSIATALGKTGQSQGYRLTSVASSKRPMLPDGTSTEPDAADNVLDDGVPQDSELSESLDTDNQRPGHAAHVPSKRPKYWTT